MMAKISNPLRSMYLYWRVLIATSMLVAMSAVGALAEGLKLIPLPKKLIEGSGSVALNSKSEVVATEEALVPLAEILAENLRLQCGLGMKVVRGRSSANGIVLALDSSYEPEAYSIEVTDTVKMIGKDYRSVAWGVATILQLIEVNEGKTSIPRLRIEDAPDYEFRSVMIDLARRWHPAETVKDTINLLWMHKINYMHLHLSDNQSFVFPSKSLPKLATPNWAYTHEEMTAIVRFADERGVTIIPEIDVPGHSGSWVDKMPEVFGTTDPATGESKDVGIVNMANEKAYEALDLLMEDLSETFSSSPYIHIGADEVSANGLTRLPEYLPYCRKHGLEEAEEGRAHELLIHFMERMAKIVEKHGKQAIVWNDFGGSSTPNARVPKEIPAMVWTGSASGMVEREYGRLINCAPMPLYIVPPQHGAPEARWMYEWNVNEFRGGDEIIPGDFLMGAQICFWEQRYNEVLPILRPRVPAFAERVWHETAGRSFEDFVERRKHTDDVVQRSIFPVTFELEGLIDPQDVTFTEDLVVSMKSTVPGTIRYTLDKEWEKFPEPGSEAYSKPITLGDTMTVSARLYDEEGSPIGGVTQQRFRKLVPAYEFRLLGPTPKRGWDEMPDFDALEVLRSGVSGVMTNDRVKQINRSMFAGVNPAGHIDVRVHDVYNRITLELNGQIWIPVDGNYEFQLYCRAGGSSLEIGGRKVIASKVQGRMITVAGNLKSGTYPIRIRHYNRNVFNDLNLKVKRPGSSKFEPFEAIVLSIADWIGKDELGSVPGDVRFIDPAKQANVNLATEKPVMVSGGTQAPNVPANAVDGITDNSSGWHSGSSPQWLQVDLGQNQRIGRIKLHNYFDGQRIYKYAIEVSTNGDDWDRVVDMTTNTEVSTKEGDEHKIVPVDARYIRLYMFRNSANSGIHVNELMVFEAEDGE